MADQQLPDANFLLNLLMSSPNVDLNSYQGGQFGAPGLTAFLDSVSGGNTPVSGFQLDRFGVNGTLPIARELLASAGVTGSQEDRGAGTSRTVSPNVALQLGPASLGAAYDVSNYQGPGANVTNGALRLTPALQFGLGDGNAYLSMDRTVGDAPSSSYQAGYRAPLAGGTLEAGLLYAPQNRLLNALLNYRRDF